MSLCPYPHELDFVLSGIEHREQIAEGTRLTESSPDEAGAESSLLTSSRPDCTLSRILATTAAYFLPCSPSKTTPEWRMMLGWVPRAIKMYPSTVRCEDSKASFDSSSGDIADAAGGDDNAEDALGAWLIVDVLPVAETAAVVRTA